ncbi:MAG: DNA polymerase I [Deltaproteobacteria bacterium RIFCSPHIGHO2_02_FULL_40_11]|nr:MAG: DNA polymerase I [Deltaproteobacteria bacterium RIFCSPHIGHO2_02_FULL_40_11]
MTSQPPLKLCLIDGSSSFYRAFFAIRPLTTSKGLHVNAIYGFTTMLMKVLRDIKPDYVAMVFDSDKETFRSEIYKEYKANREEMPSDLVEQLPYIQNVTRAFEITALQKPGFEADDIIGTVCHRFKDENLKIEIISADKDLMQLVSDNVTMIDTMRDRTFGKKEVKDKFGVGPEHVVDILGLAGDSSDNVPGVPGIGFKTAATLVQKFGTIENILKNTEQLKGKQKENLEKFEAQALLSKKLVTLELNVPMTFHLSDLKHKPWNEEALVDLFSELEFKKLIQDLGLKSKKLEEKSEIQRNYTCIQDEASFEGLLKDLKSASHFVIDLETTSLDTRQAKIVGFSFAYAEGKSHKTVYVPIGHIQGVQLNAKDVLKKIKPILEDPKIQKWGQNIKYDMLVLASNGIWLQNSAQDSMISSYLLNPAEPHNLDHLSLKYMHHPMISYKEVTKNLEKGQNFADVSIEKATEYAGEDADVTYRLVQYFQKELEKEKKLLKLYQDIEMPLVSVLAKMEFEGIQVNRSYLEILSKELDQKLKTIQKEIYESAGGEFNIQSPKQLSEILFGKLGLPIFKKTKTGRSTNEAVLKKLAERHPLPDLILTYREMAKMKSTYVDSLLELSDPKTQRVHTSFNQTIAETGRLSSSDPNLQNIPIRSEWGAKIREAFVARKGTVLLAADYSQVELRLLAHMSQDAALQEAFQKNLDIHTQTASEVFGVFEKMVSPEMRRQAKAINFGLIYGLSAFGLARQLGISVDTAKEYIERYFKRYQGVQKFIEETIQKAHAQGYVETLLGRKRALPELHSANPHLKSFGERMAVNTPLQGTAADMIKIAMIQIQNEIEKKKLHSCMLLQVHDELVFEVEKSELEEMKALVKEKMEQALKLSVPITVEIKVGKTWGNLK